MVGERKTRSLPNAIRCRCRIFTGPNRRRHPPQRISKASHEKKSTALRGVVP